MVFLSVVNLVRSRGPDEFWRKRKVFKLAAHYFGRRRNCYRLGITHVHRALAYATKGRILKKDDMRKLWETRIEAGCEEHGLNFKNFMEGLNRTNILMNKKVLSELAVWEPYTFKAITEIASKNYNRDADDDEDKDKDTNTITHNNVSA